MSCHAWWAPAAADTHAGESPTSPRGSGKWLVRGLVGHRPPLKISWRPADVSISFAEQHVITARPKESISLIYIFWLIRPSGHGIHRCPNYLCPNLYRGRPERSAPEEQNQQSRMIQRWQGLYLIQPNERRDVGVRPPSGNPASHHPWVSTRRIHI